MKRGSRNHTSNKGIHNDHPAIFALIVVLGMIGQWIMSFIKILIPELEPDPVRISFHVVGEVRTALALIPSVIV